MNRIWATIILITFFCPAVLAKGAKSIDSTKMFSVNFPAVSISLTEIEQKQISSLVTSEDGSKSCFMIKGFFSSDKSAATYRIVGRARVLEVYRLLTVAGALPHNYDISSLGPINEQREFSAKEPGHIVTIERRLRSGEKCFKGAHNSNHPSGAIKRYRDVASESYV